MAVTPKRGGRAVENDAPFPENLAGAAVKPIESQTQAEQIYSKIKHAMMIGDLQSGQSLAIGELAEHFAVSPMPVRQAITKLIAEGLLESQPKKAARIPDTSLERFKEMATIRSATEGLAVRLAAGTITKKDINRIAKINRAMNDAARDGDVARYLDLNNEFHFGVYSFCNSPMLLEMIERLLSAAGPSFRFLGAGGIGSSDVDWHERMLEALAKGDGAAAAEALDRDIQSTVDYFEQNDLLD